MTDYYVNNCGFSQGAKVSVMGIELTTFRLFVLYLLLSFMSITGSEKQTAVEMNSFFISTAV